MSPTSAIAPAPIQGGANYRTKSQAAIHKSNSQIALQGGDDEHRFISEDWLKGHLNSVTRKREPKSVLELISPTMQHHHHNSLKRRETSNSIKKGGAANNFGGASQETTNKNNDRKV